jgi:hypothetical protein
LYDNDPSYRGRKIEFVRIEGSYAICKSGPRQVKVRLDRIFSDGMPRRSGDSAIPQNDPAPDPVPRLATTGRLPSGRSLSMRSTIAASPCSNSGVTRRWPPTFWPRPPDRGHAVPLRAWGIHMHDEVAATFQVWGLVASVLSPKAHPPLVELIHRPKIPVRLLTFVSQIKPPLGHQQKRGDRFGPLRRGLCQR